MDGFYILFNLCEAPNRLPENIVCIIVIHGLDFADQYVTALAPEGMPVTGHKRDAFT